MAPSFHFREQLLGDEWETARGFLVEEFDNLFASFAASEAQASAAVPPGTWQENLFNPAHYSGTGGGTWTVGPAAIVTNRYALVGKVLFWELYLSWFSGGNLGGGTLTSAQIQLPAGLVAVSNTMSPVALFIDGGAVVPAYAGHAGNKIQFARADFANLNAGTFASSVGIVTTLVVGTK